MRCFEMVIASGIAMISIKSKEHVKALLQCHM